MKYELRRFLWSVSNRADQLDFEANRHCQSQAKVNTAFLPDGASRVLLPRPTKLAKLDHLLLLPRGIPFMLSLQAFSPSALSLLPGFSAFCYRTPPGSEERPLPSLLTPHSQAVLDTLASLSALPTPDWRYHAGDLPHGESPSDRHAGWPASSHAGDLARRGALDASHASKYPRTFTATI